MCWWGQCESELVGMLLDTVVQVVTAVLGWYPMRSPSSTLKDSQPPYYWAYSGNRS